jgi:hypothetical protein
MDGPQSIEQQRLPRGAAIIGGAIAVYALVDAWLLGPIVAIAAATTSVLLVFIVTAVAVLVVNLACCGWIDRRWEVLAPATGGRLAARLDKMRSGRFSRPIDWMTSGSDASFGLAAALVNAVIVVGATRMLGGQPVGSRRILVAALAYAIAFAGLFCILGWLLGNVIGVFLRR